MNSITPETRANWIEQLLGWEREAYLDGDDTAAEWFRVEARKLGWVQPEDYAEPIHKPNDPPPPPAIRKPKYPRRKSSDESEINRLLRGTVQAIAAAGA